MVNRRFVPSFVKSVCDVHHSDFDSYRFFIVRWVPSVSLDSEMMAVFPYYQQVRFFVFVNFSRNEDLEQFHGKAVVHADHPHSPFPAPFLIQETGLSLTQFTVVPWPTFTAATGKISIQGTHDTKESTCRTSATSQKGRHDARFQHSSTFFDEY